MDLMETAKTFRSNRISVRVLHRRILYNNDTNLHTYGSRERDRGSGERASESEFHKLCV